MEEEAEKLKEMQKQVEQSIMSPPATGNAVILMYFLISFLSVYFYCLKSADIVKIVFINISVMTVIYTYDRRG